MGNALAQFLPLIILLAATIPPAWKLTKRLGLSGAWTIMILFPLLGLVVFIWIVAFARWGIKDAQELRARPLNFG
jgi:Na+-driven multidrug efflux pump